MNKHKVTINAFSRQRKLTFFTTMVLILRKSVKSLQLSLNEFFSSTENIRTVTASAFSQARNKLSYTAFTELNNDIVKLYYKEKQDNIKTYKGYRLVGFDGCKITVPDNYETEEEFGWRAVGNNYGKNSGRCIRTTYEASYDVLNNIAIDGILGKGSVYEAHLAQKLLDNMQTMDIGIFDRAYGSYDLMAEMIKKGTNFVIRAQRQSFYEIQELYEIEEKQYSEVLNLWPARKNISKVNKSDLPNKIRVRLIKITLDNGEPEILITSLLDEKLFEINDFKEIYKLRWGIETYFGKLKGRLNIDHFSGKSLNAIKQDIWSTIFISNLETIITEDIDEKLMRESMLKGTKQKRVKKSISFNAIKNMAIEIFSKETDQNKLLSKLEKLFICNTDYVRPSRTAPRETTSGFKKWKYYKCIKKQVF